MKMPTPDEAISNAIKKVSEKIRSGAVAISDIPTENLVRILKHCNLKYRAGDSIISDDFYDHTLLSALIERDSQHEFLNQVEPETTTEKTVKLPERMLSTDKAYSKGEVTKWAERVTKVGRAFGFTDDEIKFKATPKLDGFAAYKKSAGLFTRGNGYRGTDISHTFKRGMDSLGLGDGPGEIVVDKDYFVKHLSGEFENSRNFISSVIKEGDWSEIVSQAIKTGAVVFNSFDSLAGIIVDGDRLIKGFDDIVEACLVSNFDVDGVVIECTNDKIKNEMGHTSHHHRWQIAFKQNAEGVKVKVNSLTWQTGKTGVITPVAEIEPTRIGGVTVSRATCHNYGNVKSKGIDAGAIVEIVRSGEVIPYITGVVESVGIKYPDKCPGCGSPTEVLPPAKPGEKETHLSCTNKTNCPAQVEGTIEYWFETLGNCDGFGPAVIADLVGYGVDKARTIYDLEQENFENAGLGSGISANLLDQLRRSKTEEIEDWRFLAAFSIHTVGKGGCERLLKHHKLEDIFDLTIDDFIAIDGFAEKTAMVLFESLARIRSDFDYLYGLGFNLARTPLSSESESVVSPITNKTIVVTGSLKTGSRNDIHARIKSLGGVVGKAISGKTDILVIGEKVGASKMKAAEKHGTAIMSEEAFVEMLAA